MAVDLALVSSFEYPLGNTSILSVLVFVSASFSYSSLSAQLAPLSG